MFIDFAVFIASFASCTILPNYHPLRKLCIRLRYESIHLQGLPDRTSKFPSPYIHQNLLKVFHVCHHVPGGIITRKTGINTFLPIRLQFPIFFATDVNEATAFL